jgi:hypothetical protein
MKQKQEVGDFIAELEKLDAFLDGSEPGERPLDVLHARGIDMPDETTLDDPALHERLWVVIRALAEIGMYLESTDHLSDRELYRWLRTDSLLQETFLPMGSDGGWHTSPIGGFSEEDLQVYYRYYADEDDRRRAALDGDVMPPREPLPYDRDRLMPKHHFDHGADA